MKRLSVERRRRVNGIYVKCGFSHNNDERHVKSWKINDEFYNASRLSYAWWGVNIFVRWCLHWNRQTSGKEYEIEPKKLLRRENLIKCFLRRITSVRSWRSRSVRAILTSSCSLLHHTHTHSAYFLGRAHTELLI